MPSYSKHLRNASTFLKCDVTIENDISSCFPNDKTKVHLYKSNTRKERINRTFN
jgi:hypothetical protein